MTTPFNVHYKLDKTSYPVPLETDIAPELLGLQELINKVGSATSSPSSESPVLKKNIKKRAEFNKGENSPESYKIKKASFDTNNGFKAPVPPSSPVRVNPSLLKANVKTGIISPVLTNWGTQEQSAPPPPTPMKKNPRTNRTPQEVAAVSPFQVNQERLSTGKFQIEFNVNEIDSGSYATVYEIEHIPGVILKAFHGIKMGFKEKHLTDCLVQMQINYNDIVKLGLPVATVLNVSQLVEHKYILQERIPHKLDRTNQAQMVQVQKFFALSIERQVMMDLQPQNLRVKDDGTVVLIDFVEEEDDVAIFITKACKEWIAPCATREEAEKLLTFLTAGLYDKTWINEILGTTESPKKHDTGAHEILKQ